MMVFDQENKCASEYRQIYSSALTPS